MLDLDFCILTLPRSGSHMLASALDSHPDIRCRGEAIRLEPLYNWLGTGTGKVKGAIIWPVLFDKILSRTKVIVLTRNHEDMARGLGHVLPGAPHALTPVQIEENEVGYKHRESAEMRWQRLHKLSASIPEAFITSYEEITGNKDIRVIPETVGRKLCDFLGVEYFPLTPKFYKPRVA